MKRFLFIPAALVVFQAQAASLVKLPITQENHHYWKKCVSAPLPGATVIAVLNHDVPAPAGQKGLWAKGIDYPLGSRLLGNAKQGADDKVIVTFDRMVLPDSNEVRLEPISLVGLKEGE